MTTRERILQIVATDRTFERAEVRGADVWAGKCLHCNTQLLVGLDGAPRSRATIEHIVPRAAGGSDELGNLALACARCNHEKGVRHDQRRRADPRLAEIAAALTAKRQERWRDPEVVGMAELVRRVREQEREEDE